LLATAIRGNLRVIDRLREEGVQRFAASALPKLPEPEL
jgi:hypothetical protein